MDLPDRHGGAGRAAMRRYKELSRDWRRRTFGRRILFYWWATYGLSLVLALEWTPAGWRFGAGLVFGMVGAALLLLPDLLLPDHIARWERGAWGEQSTARALKALRKEGWVIRHDIAGKFGNRDHIVAGEAVYLLDSKLLKDEVWLEGDVLHVERIGAPGDGYQIGKLTPRMRNAARSLEHELAAALTFPVAVYPVVVIWGGNFEAGVQYVGNVAYVEGERLTDWLRARPSDLHDKRKRDAVAKYVRQLPHA